MGFSTTHLGDSTETKLPPVFLIVDRSNCLSLGVTFNMTDLAVQVLDVGNRLRCFQLDTAGVKQSLESLMLLGCRTSVCSWVDGVNYRARSRFFLANNDYGSETTGLLVLV